MVKRNLGIPCAIIGAILSATAGTATAGSHLWSFFPAFSAPGWRGIVLADLDNAGHRVAVVSGMVVRPPAVFPEQPLIAVLELRDDMFAVSQVVLLPDGDVMAGPLQRIRWSGHPGDLVAVPITRAGAPGGTQMLALYGGTPLAVVDEVVLPASFRVRQMVDVDGDGNAEVLGILAASSNSNAVGAPALANGSTGALLWSDPALGVRYIGAGEIGESTRAIVVGNSSPPLGLVLDGATRQVLWSWPEGFRGHPLFGNFAGPATATEFAIVQPWGATRLFQASPSFSPLSEFSTGEIQAQAAADVNGDGIDELVLGEAQWGSVIAYAPGDGSALFTLPNQAHGVSAIAVGELTAGAGQHVIHGAGLTSSGPYVLSVHEIVTGMLKYEAYDESGPYSSIRLANAGDGAGDLAFTTFGSHAGSQGANLVILDPDTGAERRRRPSVLIPEGLQFGQSIRAGNLDADTPQGELAIGSGFGYDTAVMVVDSVSLETKWFRSLEIGPAVEDLILVDVDGDLEDDVAVAAGGRIIMFDGASGAELWRSASFQADGALTMVGGPLTSTGSHAVALGVGRRIYVMDLGTQTVSRFQEFPWAVIGQHVESQSGQCLHVVVHAGGLDRRDCGSGDVVSSATFPVPAIYVGMPDGSFGPVVVSDGVRVHLVKDSQLLASSAVPDRQLGWRNRGESVLADGWIRTHIGGIAGVHLFEFELPLFRNGFENGQPR